MTGRTGRSGRGETQGGEDAGARTDARRGPGENRGPAKRRDPLGRYDAGTLEPRLYAEWEQEGYFTAGAKGRERPFVIVLPPPNVTGVLHMGHALGDTVQDILIRFRRMQGYDALWLPGEDHAGIATQARVEATLQKTEGKSRRDLGREEFLRRVWAWKEEYAEVIRGQIRRLGASVDWSRERFTMDEGLSRAVREVFVSLYEKGLIYRGKRIINWCPRCGTALSDIEVEHEETDGALYHIRYLRTDGSGFVTVATTRPETLFGDTAVAVNPGDGRYGEFVGKSVRLPFIGREIPVIADAHADPEFGTGVVKITPAHDPNDFEVGMRHGLPFVNVLTGDGRLNEEAGPFAGLDRFEARKRIVESLSDEGLLTRTEHRHSVGHCERCGTVVEPWLSTQWFVKMRPLAEPALQAVARGEVRFVPERFEKVYDHWLENIRDWCVSRQLWWGHRIPAWYCEDCAGITVSRTVPETCGQCGGTSIHQDEDVLDTWFSSALWPFSTMGWPDGSPDLKRYFPTHVLVTGYDILYFWVARMIFMSLEFTGKAPFSDVLLTGLVKDADGRKMSKSLGNGIDPMEIVKRYSADALRYMLATSGAVGQDVRFYVERVEAAQSLVTKVWNAAKFVLMNVDETVRGDLPEADKRSLADRYILHRLQDAVDEATRGLEGYQLAEAGRAVYEFFWNDFCDWYIELSKVNLYEGTESSRRASESVLVYVLDRALRLLHPFMPFVTEAIWREIPSTAGTLTLADWPESDEGLRDGRAVEDMAAVMDVIRAVRSMRHDMVVPLSRKVPVHIRPASGDGRVFEQAREYIVRLCNPSVLVLDDAAGEPPAERVTAVLTAAEVYIPLAGVIDRSAEMNRLKKEKATLDEEVIRLQRKLGNPDFVGRAPAAIVEKERVKLADYEEKRDRVEGQLHRLGRVASGQGDE